MPLILWSDDRTFVPFESTSEKHWQQNDKNKKNCGQIGLACPDDKCKKIKDQCERYKYIVENNKLNRHVYSLNNYNDKCSTGFYKGAIFFAPLNNIDGI